MDKRVGKVVARDFKSMARYICIGEGDSYREFEVDLGEALELWRTLNEYVADDGCSMRFKDETPGGQHSFGFTPRSELSEVAPAHFDGEKWEKFHNGVLQGLADEMATLTELVRAVERRMKQLENYVGSGE